MTSNHAKDNGLRKVPWTSSFRRELPNRPWSESRSAPSSIRLHLSGCRIISLKWPEFFIKDMRSVPNLAVHQLQTSKLSWAASTWSLAGCRTSRVVKGSMLSGMSGKYSLNHLFLRPKHANGIDTIKPPLAMDIGVCHCGRNFLAELCSMMNVSAPAPTR